MVPKLAFRHPQMFVKVGDSDEINIESITSNLKYLSIDSTPAKTNQYLDSTGSDGANFLYSTYDKTTVTANFALRFSNYWDYKLKKREIYRIFLTKEKIRLRTDSEGTVRYVYSTPFEIKPNEDGANFSLFSIVFDNPSGLSYSLASTLEAQSYSDGNWGQYGLFIPVGKDISYHFINQQHISVYNGSDMPIDPYYSKHYLRIIMKHSGGKFGLVNNTTNTSWKYTGSMSDNDILILDGINTFKNGNPDSSETDFGYITLAQGFNDISITNIQDLDITFDFYYQYIY